MEFLIYVCIILFALGICGAVSDYIGKMVLNKKPSKKVLVHVYDAQDRYIGCYVEKCVLDKHKHIIPVAKKCA